MSWRRNISVKYKIVVIVTVICAIAVLMGMAFNVTTRIVETKREYKNDAVVDAQLIGDDCVMPIEFDSPLRADKLLVTRINRGRVSSVAIYKADGVLFSSASSDGDEVPDRVTPYSTLLEWHKNELVVQELIYHNGIYFGTVFLHYETGLRDFIIRQIVIAIILLLVIVIITYFLALHFQKYISLPILNLAEIAANISETQNFSTTIQKESNDEVGLLYDRFNQMLSAINTRETERDRAQSALKQSEEKFRNIFNFSLDGVLVTNIDGVVLEASSRASEIFDIEVEELKGRSMLTVMPASYSKQRGMILKEIQTRGEFTFVTNYKTADDTERFLEFSTKLINHEGESGLLSLVRDITTRIKADEALRESEERYKKLVENLPSAIALHRNGKIVFVNDAIKMVLNGKTKEQFIDRNILDFIPENNKEIISNHFAITDVNAASPSLELTMLQANGDEIEAELTSMPLYFNRQKAILTVFKDISSRKKIENDLVVALQKAEESDKLKSSFLANMSHEIRTPMNGIIGFADLLKKDNLSSADLKRYVDVIRTSADRLLGIINDIIDISKIEAGVINVVNEQFDLKELVNDIFQFFIPQAQKKGIEFNLETYIGERTVIKSDRTKISQIVTNLLSNAIKFTHKGEVIITCSLEGGQMRVQVKDSGIGIPEDQQLAIFERFRQADHYLQDFKEGTGLGLSISRGFARALGGDISVVSEFEKGAVFMVEIPVGVENAIVPAPELNNNEELQLAGKCILIVEDEENNYLYLKELLEPTGATILWADNGLKAIQIVLDNADVDFVLMDIKLPVMDGFTAAQKIKAYKGELPIVAQTAFGLEGDKEKTLAAGLDDYIPKPIIKEELFSVIRKFL